MKHRILFLLVMSSVLCSCAKEINDMNPSQSADDSKFTATIADESETKASIGEKTDAGYPVLWSANDSISVMTSDGERVNAKLVLTNGAGTATASFNGECGSYETYFAIYPYDNGHKMAKVNGKDAPYVQWDGSEQIAHSGSCDPAKLVMTACGTEDESGKVNLSFKNVLSFVKFTTDYKCKSVTFESNNKALNVACEAFRVSGVSTTSVPVIYPAVERGTTKVTLNAADDGVIEAGTYYMAVLPGVLNEGFTITFTGVTLPIRQITKTYSKSYDSSLQLMRNKILNLGTLPLASNLAELDGYGTSDSPYLVDDFAQLELMRDRSNRGESGYVDAIYRQTSDIDMASRPAFTPIGNNEHMFAGDYDGDGHKISNITLGHFTSDKSSWTAYGMDESGLFGNLYVGSICNLTVENPVFSGSGCSTFGTIGAICSHAYSDEEGQYKCSIRNCKASGKVTYKADGNGSYGLAFGGGILGASNANIEIIGCTNELSIEVNSTSYSSGGNNTRLSLGGIVGYAGPVRVKPGDSDGEANALAVIDRCRNNADLSFSLGDKEISDPAVGGILGRAVDNGYFWYQNVAVHVSNCVNTGNISLSGTEINYSFIGGIAGHNDSDGFTTGAGYSPEFFNCFNKGSLNLTEASGYAGGVIGYDYDDDTSVKMCVNNGEFSKSGTSYKVWNEIAERGKQANCFSKNDGKTASDLNAKLASDYKGYDAVNWIDTDSGLDLDF